MPDLPLDVGNDLTGIGLIPAPVEILRHHAELDDKIGGQILRLGLAALFPPQPEQGILVIAHDDPGVRAAYKSGGDSSGWHVQGFKSSSPYPKSVSADSITS